ncbi:energy-coupled thiamine transporter ThiT [uncultured Clostridium sp.]|uniref:energy-coupled thiamine transporter ThiT n=1 Tax=uncultured Clostridium sp. TaxID=59620 RepID=UPI002614FB76|nr:energy-coupled thiamine transporter ThiT [uncultured Clostridium sp.]
MHIFQEWFHEMSKAFSDLPSKFHEVVKDPMVILALVGLLLIFLAFFKARKVKFNARMLTSIAIALALSTILDLLRLFHFPQGGDITLGAMLPILLITFAYGKEVGFITGFLYGFIALITDPYILQPIQVLFDYPLPGIAMGVAGFFMERRQFGTIVAFFFAFLAHFISGVAFFGSSAPAGMNVFIYSIVYNIPYLVGNMIICMILLKLLPVERLLKIINPNYISRKSIRK